MSTSSSWHNKEMQPLRCTEGRTAPCKGDRILPSVGILNKEIPPHSMFVCLWTGRGEMGQQKAPKRNNFKRQRSFFATFFLIFAWGFRVLISLHSFPPMVCHHTGLAKSSICISRVLGLPFGSCLSRKQLLKEKHFNIIINKHKIRSLCPAGTLRGDLGR